MPNQIVFTKCKFVLQKLGEYFMKKCLNVVFSLLLLFLVGLGITSCEPEAPKVYGDDSSIK